MTRCLLTIAVVLAWSVRPAPLVAAEDSTEIGGPIRTPSTSAIRVGFDGFYKLGRWTPVRLVAPPSDSKPYQLEATCPDGDGVPCTFQGEANSPWLCVRIGRPIDQLHVARREYDVRLSEAAPTTIEPTLFPSSGLIPLEGRQELILSLDESLKLSAAPLPRRKGSTRTIIDHDPGSLPPDWWALEGVDLIVATAQSLAGGVRSNPGLTDMLQRWIKQGGKLLLVAGHKGLSQPNAREAVAPFLPGKLANEPVSIRQLRALAAWIDRADPMPEGAVYQLPQLTEIADQVLVTESNVPVIVHSPYGLGEIVFASLDLDEPPFANWRDRGELLRKLIQVLLPLQEDRAEEQTAVANRYGWSDVSGQLRNALDQFDQIPFVPFWLVATLIGLYAVLLYPGGYLFVRRVVKRPGLAWILFPLFVVVTSGGTWWLARRLKGDTLHVNSVELIDIDLTTNTQRGVAWHSLYSPTTSTWDISLEDKNEADPPPTGATTSNSTGSATDTPNAAAASDLPSNVSLLAWQGLNGEGFGAMNTTMSAAAERFPYRASPDDRQLENVPIQQGATKNLTTRWARFDDRRLADNVEARLRLDGRGFVKGTLTNRTPHEWTDIAIAFGSLMLTPREDKLPSGATLEVNDIAGPLLETASKLRQPQISFDPARKHHDQISTPYDPGSFDVPRIMQALMFYRVMGGQGYIKLLHRHEPELDLSEHMRLERAIVLYRTTPNGPLLRIGGQPLAADQVRRANWTRVIVGVDPYVPEESPPEEPTPFPNVK